jgi:signal transduction histidine kinase
MDYASCPPYDRLMRRLAAWAVALPPRRQDLALALALAAYYVGSLIPEARQLRLPDLAFALVTLQALPLIWRRRWPVATLLIIGIPRNLYDQLNIGFAPLPLASLIAFYTVMDRSSVRVRWVMGALVLAGIIQGQTTPGHTEPYDFFIALLEFAAAGMAGVLSRTRRAYLQEAEARAEQAEAERDRQVALAAALEQTRIARELHDVVAHHVSLIAVQSEAAASLLPGRPADAAKSVEIIGQTARETLTELRRLLGVLRAPAGLAGPAGLGGLVGLGGLGGLGGHASTSPAPSISALDEVLAGVRKAGIAVNLTVEGSPGKLPPGVDLAAYRIVQEALTNTVRHSGASEAAVVISHEPGYVTVSVTDTGPGPAAPAGAVAGWPAGPAAAGVAGAPNGSSARPAGPVGFGLAGITERVASCGGSLTVGPGTVGGFAVKARLPVS